MRSCSPTLPGVLAALSLALSACGPEPVAPPDRVRNTGAASILTTFDRVTVAPREVARFQAAMVSSGRLTSTGLTFAIRDRSVANLTTAGGRAQVQGLAAGRTWVVVQGAAASDSVEVVVD